MRRRIVYSIFAVMAMLASVFFYSSCDTKTDLHSKESGTGVEVSRAKTYSNIRDMSTDSQVIVIGTIKKVLESIEKPDEHMYMTNFVFRIETIFKGEIPDEIIVSQHGTHDTPWYVVKDDPLFKAGEKYLLFLNKNYLGTYYYYGPCARYKIDNDKIISMNYILPDKDTYIAPDQLNFKETALSSVTSVISETLNTVRFLCDDEIILLSGETGIIFVTLATGNKEMGNVNFSLSRISGKKDRTSLPMPDGLTITINPDSYGILPNKDYDSVITIGSDERIITPGEYWILAEYAIGDMSSGEKIIRVEIDEKKLSDIESTRNKLHIDD
jgi:hypothetical protein